MIIKMISIASWIDSVSGSKICEKIINSETLKTACVIGKISDQIKTILRWDFVEIIDSKKPKACAFEKKIIRDENVLVRNMRTITPHRR